MRGTRLSSQPLTTSRGSSIFPPGELQLRLASNLGDRTVGTLTASIVNTTDIIANTVTCDSLYGPVIFQLQNNFEAAFRVAAPLEKGTDASGDPELRLASNLGTVTVDTLTANVELVADTMRARAANELTIADNLVVTGNLTVNGSSINPYFVNGYVSGNALTFSDRGGQTTVTVTRASGYASGVYEISMSSPHPRGASYVIQATPRYSGYLKVWDTYTPTATTFSIVTYSFSGNLTNGDFYLTVCA